MSFWSKLRHFLWDDTAARENYRDVEETLRRMLAVSRGDGNFYEVLNQVLEARKPGSSWGRAPRFAEFVARSCRPADRNAPWAVVVEHIIEDLPTIYGLSKTSAGETDR